MQLVKSFYTKNNHVCHVGFMLWCALMLQKQGPNPKHPPPNLDFNKQTQVIMNTFDWWLNSERNKHMD